MSMDVISNLQSAVDGITHVVHLSADGIPIGSTEGTNQDTVDRMAAAASGLFSLSTELATEPTIDSTVLQVVIEHGQGYVFLKSAGQEGRLIVSATSTVDPGKAAQQMEIAIGELRKLGQLGAVRNHAS